MLQKFIEFIKHLDYYELKILKETLENEQFKVLEIIKREMKKYEYRPNEFCAVCGKPLDEVNYVYTLIFGPPDFRKKASFCGKDCMLYFINYLERSKDQSQQVFIDKEYY